MILLMLIIHPAMIMQQNPITRIDKTPIKNKFRALDIRAGK